ncbi:dihydroxy-acid dehydratase [Emergencia sp.]|uniref:dihydroxy-acid dehydratase n=1 Tax=Emergencia sp. TaxID=1926557 RepID=UPI003AEF4010
MDFTNKIFDGPIATHCRATYKGSGYDPRDLANRPHIGIANAFSEHSPGHKPLREQVEAIKNGIWQAGGIPFEFGIPSTCAEVAIGHCGMEQDMAMRDLVAGSCELVSNIQHFDGLVLAAGCDNIVPGTLLAAARTDKPTICFVSGPMLSGRFGKEPLALGDVLEMSVGELNKNKGTVDERYMEKLEMGACPTGGACPLFGTANTMQVLVEALGMTPEYSSTIPAVYTDKMVSAQRIGRRIVEMVFEDLRPSQIMTREAIENAIRLDLAIGGSLNAILHLLAIGNELGIPEITLDLFDRMSHETPCIVNIKPCGEYTVDKLFYLGGVPAIMKQIEGQLHKECLNVSGHTMGEILQKAPAASNDVIHGMENPLTEDGGLAVLKGNLAPKGCVMRSSSVAPSMHHFCGQVRVYDSDAAAYDALMSGEVKPGSVIVVRYAGPIGAPGMVEVECTASAIINLKLDESVALVTDGRFSGFNHGPIVGHVSPEAAAGGLIAYVENGDFIEIDIEKRSISLLVDEEDIKERKKQYVPPAPKLTRGFMRTYAKNCLPAELGGAMQKWD